MLSMVGCTAGIMSMRCRLLVAKAVLKSARRTYYDGVTNRFLSLQKIEVFH